MRGLCWIGMLCLLFAVSCQPAAPCEGCPKDARCVEGSCACPEGKDLCGEVCVDLQRDRGHCGTCHGACKEGQSCREGACHDSAPPPGGCSDPLQPDACGSSCVNLLYDAQNCGRCKVRCRSNQECAGELCVCLPGLVECDGECIEPNTARHCGACLRACDAAKVCSEGRCLSQCPKAQEKCLGGCFDTSTSPHHCGKCGNRCAPGEVCDQGRCLCPPGKKRCGGQCVDTLVRWSHCGDCDASCKKGQLCAEGRCVTTCPSKTPTACFGGCFDTQTSEDHCGACGNRCLGEQKCVAGTCSCEGGKTACHGRCVDLQSDPFSCGSCTRACLVGQKCQAGKCQRDDTCPAGETRCAPGCVDLQQNDRHCGACDSPCPSGQVCQGGTCQAQQSCSGGETPCGSRCCGKGQLCCKGQCIPQSPEECNGRDDDCDGQVDEGAAGVGKDCTLSSEKGRCRQGKTVCKAGKLACESQYTPVKEDCSNGLDDDCNGKTDDGPGCSKCIAKDSRVCYTGPGNTADVGACKKGRSTCSAQGEWGPCVGEVVPRTEECNGKDDNCDGQIDEGNPGAGASCTTAQPGVCAPGKRSCQVGKLECVAQVAPSSERCNGKDDDCDGKSDEDLKQSCYTGTPGTAGKGICKAGTQTCSGGKWGACVGQVKPEPKELCNNKDDDCDGTTDEGCGCTPQDTQACGSDVGECKKGTQTCDSKGNWGLCTNEVKGSSEVCNGKDDDCDGQTDEDFSQLGSPCTAGVGQCRKAGTIVCNGRGDGVECSVKAGSPSAEICDDKDNDCNGQVDDNLSRPCFSGGSGCTKQGQSYACKGLCQSGTQTCAKGQWGSCTGQISPAAEVCDGKDNDCDGLLDEGCNCTPTDTRPCGSDMGECKKGTQTCKSDGRWGSCVGGVRSTGERCDGKDNDCDGIIDEDWSTKGNVCSVGVGECQRNGTLVCDNSQTGLECSATPGTSQQEICDGKDNDCDGNIDENLTRKCYTGSSGCISSSGGDFICMGVCKAGTQTCTGGSWPSACSGEIKPSAESCNGLDDDCDGLVDDNLTRACYSGSAATRGKGACRDGVEICNNGSWGSCQGDITPKAETCNSVDDDCDGAIDNGIFGSSCYGDQMGECKRGMDQCLGGVRSCMLTSTVTCTSDSDCLNCPSSSNKCDLQAGICRKAGVPHPDH